MRSNRLGKLILLAAARFGTAASWETFVTETRGPSNLQHNIADRTNHHPAGHYLDRLRPIGAPVLQTTKPWTRSKISTALARGSHQSALSHLEFLRDEMADMIDQGYWVILPYSSVLHLPHLRLSPLGVVPQRDRRPRIIVDYTFWGINEDTVALAPSEAMQFGRAFDRILHKIRRANRRYGPTYMIKVDIADGFYRLFVSAPTTANLGVVFPQHEDEEPLVAFPLVLPMGWVGSPPFFCALTETSTDLANHRLNDTNWKPPPHRLSPVADAADNFKPVSRRPAQYLSKLDRLDLAATLPHTKPFEHCCHTPSEKSSVGVPPTQGRPVNANASQTGPPVHGRHPHNRVPTIQSGTGPASQAKTDPPTVIPGPAASAKTGPTNSRHPLGVPTTNHALIPLRRPLAYVDVYMDDFLGLAQGHPGLRERVRSTIFHSIDDVLRPNSPTDHAYRNEPISLSKLAKGDAKWATRKVLLGWIVDTVSETIELPEHRRTRFLEILETLQSRRRVSLKDWHKAKNRRIAKYDLSHSRRPGFLQHASNWIYTIRQKPHPH
ncbi:hypothetical protein [Janthinobacterium sp.]|uniref:hypothetical protein n=1 Tax=Janthinobacterium sp. TaxID=1871054 RepID=UPI00293D49CE|nr:hypothetical protein [Janthinobacterium sp.]